MDHVTEYGEIYAAAFLKLNGASGRKWHSFPVAKEQRPHCPSLKTMRPFLQDLVLFYDICINDLAIICGVIIPVPIME